MTVGEVIAELRRQPELLLRNWNWKAACFSAGIRAGIYFVTSLKAGWRAGVAAMLVEAAYRIPLSGLLGAFTQSLRFAQPAWTATLTVAVCLPAIAHSIELLVHWLQGAPNLRTSFEVSVAFTVLASLFNLHAMRQGVLVVGEGRSFAVDLRQIPVVLAGFVAAIPLWAYRSLARRF